MKNIGINGHPYKASFNVELQKPINKKLLNPKLK